MPGDLRTTIGIYAVTFAWTVVGLLASPLGFAWFRFAASLSTQEATRKLIWIYGRVWVRLTALIIPVRLDLHDLPSPCILVANHASFFDMFFIGGQPLWDVCFAVRDWPFRIPFYRPFMQAAEYIRTENRTLDEIREQAETALRNGTSLFFFPEGTRSSNGKLNRFRSGAFHLSLQTGVPVAPLCLSGTHRLLPKGTWFLNASEVQMRLLSPIDPDRYRQTANGHVQMRKDVQRSMAHALREMSDPCET